MMKPMATAVTRTALTSSSTVLSSSTRRITKKTGQIYISTHSSSLLSPPSAPRRLYSTTSTLQNSWNFDGRAATPTTGTGILEISQWPITKTNTFINIVPQGKRMVVERLGKMHAIHESGYFFAIPFIDHIAYVIDVRERAIDILPQSAITRDNVSVEVSGNLFVRVLDPERAAYGARNPLYAVMQHAQSAMRSAIGEMELDEILHGRARLNSLIKGSLQEAAVVWGLEVRRYEITEITPDEQIRIAMDKQAAAERDRREQVLRAEGDKRRAELTSEGEKIRLTNESEGTLVKVRNEAEAQKTKLLREAEGEAAAMRLKAEAQAAAISAVAAEMNKEGGVEAAKLALARDLASMYGEMGQKSNTMIFNDRPGDLTALLSQAAVAIKAADKSTEETK
uniref:Band 7 domain-containing protein n=3 Tax=Ditylum brightwellii TaxID=49249 RepID=A0A7S4RAI5_9STRA|mmetsp:Transcript_19566/g.28458  ORF Transcript_19566/g.28458 Transcript_19566/m.28458 type:complete len:396 (+) Transcript_19566:76-1263(+)